MPIYEYHCDSCEKTFEAIRKFSDAPLTSCRECGATGVRKLLSAPAFRLKGGGWYETDFKSDNQRNVARSDSESGSSGNAAAESGKDKGSTGDSASSKQTSSDAPAKAASTS